MTTFYQDAAESIGSVEGVLRGIYKKMSKGSDIQLSAEVIEKFCGSKKDISEMLFNMMTVSIDCIKVLQAGCAEVDLLKSESKEAFKELTEVQAELLESKTRQIEMMQTEVKNTLKTEIKSYSDAVKKASGEMITIKKIKSVVEDVVEDRSKNLMIFGLDDNPDKPMISKVTELFEYLGEKPMFSAERIGRKTPGKVQPVRVALTRADTVFRLLSKARRLKESDKYGKVFLSLDRNVKQREELKSLVREKEEKSRQEPDKLFFIRKGKICSEPRESSKKDEVDIASEEVIKAVDSAGVSEEKSKPAPRRSSLKYRERTRGQYPPEFFN